MRIIGGDPRSGDGPGRGQRPRGIPPDPGQTARDSTPPAHAAAWCAAAPRCWHSPVPLQKKCRWRHGAGSHWRALDAAAPSDRRQGTGAERDPSRGAPRDGQAVGGCARDVSGLIRVLLVPPVPALGVAILRDGYPLAGGPAVTPGRPVGYDRGMARVAGVTQEGAGAGGGARGMTRGMRPSWGRRWRCWPRWATTTSRWTWWQRGHMPAKAPCIAGGHRRRSSRGLYARVCRHPAFGVSDGSAHRAGGIRAQLVSSGNQPAAHRGP